MKFLLLLISLNFLSCVGTIEEGSALKSTTVNTDKMAINFAGVEEVLGIADDKVEVYFKSARGGSEEFEYYIYVGGGTQPIIVPSDVLSPDNRGLLRYTLVGLQAGTRYKIKVDVKDQNDPTLETITDTILETRTFFNNVCDFAGIGSLQNLPGVDGVDSIRVNWPQAISETDGLLINPDSDPLEYEISIINANFYSPQDFDNVNLNGGFGRVTTYVQYNPQVQSVTVRGLTSNTRYFVRMRCLHRGTVVDLSKPWLKWEMNNKYLEITTLSNELSSIVYNPDEIQITPGVGLESFSTFTMTWGLITGVFDHYRIYYSEGPIVMTDTCEVNQIVPGSNTYCKKTDYSSRSLIIHPLNPDSNYNVRFVICQTPECGSANRIIAKNFVHNTFPAVAPFLGIEDILFAGSLAELGDVRLKFTAPNLAQGYFDGFVVSYKSNISDETSTDITHEDYDGDMYIQYHEPDKVSSLYIYNVPYNVQTCFNIAVFIYDKDGDRVIYPNNNWICKTPLVVAPSATDFVGLADVTFTNSNQNTILFANWGSPSRGIYDEYYVFVRHDGGGFSFSQAITDFILGDTSRYLVFTVSSETNLMSVPNLLPNRTYRIGVLSHYQDYTGSFFSETNTNVFRCIIGTPPANGSTQLGNCSL
jgi:hypothetical protein